MTRTIRKIVRIDEALCDGCGECIPSCAEGAIAVVEGKARVLAEALCDGLGACIGLCPRGAITVEDREAEPFDEAQVRARWSAAPALTPAVPRPAVSPPGRPRLTIVQGSGPAACPTVPTASVSLASSRATPGASRLGHWPVQLELVSPEAPFLRGADLLVAADCVPFACPGFHEDLLRGRALVIGCPKLDDVRGAVAKLEAIFRAAGVRSVTVARMEVPCCAGLSAAARRGLAAAGASAPVTEVVVGVDGTLRRG
jgi:NAD-dependent dihydropyrimidine dehydrogenase PreA subunit